MTKDARNDRPSEIGPGLLRAMPGQLGLTKDDLPDLPGGNEGERMQFIYPYTVFQSEDGAWQVRFPDVPEALTEGDTEAEAHALATDVLLAALGGLVKMKRDIPGPSAADAGPVVVVPMLQSARLAPYKTMREGGLNNVTLARKLGLVEGEVRRMLDLGHQTGIGTLERALWQLGKQMASEVRRAA